MSRTLVLILCVLSFSFHIQGQKPFEGRIIYDVEYVSFPDGMEGAELSLPQQVTMIVKGENLRIVQQSAIAGELLQIHKAGIDSVYQIFHFMQRHVLMVEPIEDKSIRFRVIEKDEIKNILGVDTRQMYLQSGTGENFYAWVDRKYLNPLKVELSGLKYLPLEYSIVRNGITMKLTARELKHEPIDNTYFMLPENIVRIRNSDLHKIMN